jgi:hypothetical protein
MKYVLFVVVLAISVSAATTESTAVTFHKDVLPILQQNCQGCHRPGEATPMPFLTYKETRPWAKAIREAVRLKRMPPWFADPHVGKFANERRLSDAQIDTLARWADSGAPEGNAKDAPAPRSFMEGWNIGKPDMVIEMPVDYEVPASGTIEYTYFVMPTNFTEDRWVQLAEIRPGNRKVVHHVIAFVREPGSKWLPGAQPGVAFVPKKGTPGASSFGGQWLVGYAPGFVPDLNEPGTARLIKAGSDIVIQMHYTANGKSEKDRSKVGLIFAKEPPKQRIYTLAAANNKFVIPPGADNYRVDSKITLDQDMVITSLIPHMHLRGKSFEYRIVHPDGQREEMLSVPKYDFNWQLTYVPEKPIKVTKGTVIECTAYFDNSRNNRHNPDPDTEVRFGEQSWEEMMIGFFNTAFDPSIPLEKLVKHPPRQQERPATSGAE